MDLGQVTAPTAAEICRRYDLPAELQTLLDGNPTPLGFLDRLLLQEERSAHGIDFLAHALPKRSVIWWGCLCIQLTGLSAPLGSKDRLALRTATRWITEPSEEHRRAAQLPGEVAGPTSPAGCLATAVFESGGSVLPPDQPAVEPTRTATAQGIRNALHLLAAQAPADQMLALYRRMVALGIGLAIRVAETVEKT